MIKLNDDYSVDVTPKSFTLLRLRGKTKKGADSWEIIGYYSTLRAAIRACISNMTRRKLSEGAHDLREALEIIKESDKILTDMLESRGIKND